VVDLKSGELVLKVTLLYGLHSEDLGVSIDDVVDPTVDGCLHSGGIGGSLCTFVGFLVGALSLGNTLLLIDSGNLSVDAGLDCSDILRAHNKDVSRDDAWNLCGDRRENDIVVEGNVSPLFLTISTSLNVSVGLSKEARVGNDEASESAVLNWFVASNLDRVSKCVGRRVNISLEAEPLVGVSRQVGKGILGHACRWHKTGSDWNISRRGCDSVQGNIDATVDSVTWTRLVESDLLNTSCDIEV